MRFAHFSMNSQHFEHSLNNSLQKHSTRFVWLDWMKAIGIWLIVYGHFFSYYDIYVYVFSVPLFFIISGFLCKKESDNRVFWKKTWFNLAVPLIIICTLNYLISPIVNYALSGNPTLPENPLSFYGKLLIGMHGPLGPFWFVYTLIILKIIHQYTAYKCLHVLWFVVCFALAYVINNYDIEIMGVHPFKSAYAITNTLVSYPFFIIGCIFRKWKDVAAKYQFDKGTSRAV